MANQTTTTTASREAYCASKYGCIWTGYVDEMREDYSYPHDTKYFASIEEADAYAEALRESLQECL